MPSQRFGDYWVNRLPFPETQQNTAYAADALVLAYDTDTLQESHPAYRIHLAPPMHLEVFRGAAWATKQTLAQFALADTCQHPLTPMGVSRAWNALRYMHLHITNVAHTADSSRFALGQDRLLTAEQHAIFKQLPLTFAPTHVPARPKAASHYELVVPTLYETFRLLEDRTDYADFFPRIGRVSLLFLADFVNKALKPVRPIGPTDI